MTPRTSSRNVETERVSGVLTKTPWLIQLKETFAAIEWFATLGVPRVAISKVLGLTFDFNICRVRQRELVQVTAEGP